MGILTLVYFQWTISRRWPTNVYCNAEQICPKPRFRTCARCLLLCLGAPPCVNAACANIVFVKSQLCGGAGAFATCFLWLPRAPLVSSFVSCLLVAVGRSGLVKATKLVKSTEISHTFPAYVQVILIIQCICIFGSTPLLPQVNLVHPWACLGLVRATKLVNQQRFPQTSWRFFNLLFVYNVLTFFGAHHVSPRSAWCTHPGFL